MVTIVLYLIIFKFIVISLIQNMNSVIVITPYLIIFKCIIVPVSEINSRTEIFNFAVFDCVMVIGFTHHLNTG